MMDKNDSWEDEFVKEWITVTDYLKSLPYDLNKIVLMPKKGDTDGIDQEDLF